MEERVNTEKTWLSAERQCMLLMNPQCTQTYLNSAHETCAILLHILSNATPVLCSGAIGRLSLLN